MSTHTHNYDPYAIQLIQAVASAFDRSGVTNRQMVKATRLSKSTVENVRAAMPGVSLHVACKIGRVLGMKLVWSGGVRP